MKECKFCEIPKGYRLVFNIEKVILCCDCLDKNKCTWDSYKENPPHPSVEQIYFNYKAWK